jgi:hypothetical protein
VPPKAVAPDAGRQTILNTFGAAFGPLYNVVGFPRAFEGSSFLPTVPFEVKAVAAEVAVAARFVEYFAELFIGKHDCFDLPKSFPSSLPRLERLSAGPGL